MIRLTEKAEGMKSAVEYLDAVKARLNLRSDDAASRVLGVTPSAVSKYRVGRAHFDDDICVRVADILGIDALQVIAAANYERARTDVGRAIWAGLAQRLASHALGATLAAQPARASSSPLDAPSSNDMR
ncbi:DUF3693 domain-containing protein [Pandoraea sp. NPDC087047]|uniref:DUF3693 domain-containing protein n=1 Tax=Pandoraea sp. NPDC087047 TaxID=3364390 RepID=UPI00380B795D